MGKERHFITYRDREGRERVYHLSTALEAGRSDECHIVIDEEGVSRKHCRFSLKKNRVVLHDLDSTNGTFLNGARIREAVVRPGDRVVVGSCTLNVLFGDAVTPLQDGRTQVLGQTTIEALMGEEGTAMPGARALMEAGFKGDALKALYRITETVNAVQEKEKVLQESLDVLMDLFHMDLGCILLPAGDGFTFEPVLTRNRAGQGNYHPSSSVIQKVLEENVSVIATDTFDEPSLLKAPSVVGAGTACIMCVPMRSAGKVSGAVYLSSLEPRGPLPRETLQLFTAMATQIGLALQSLSHVERLERDNRALRASVGEPRRLVGSSPSVERIRSLIEKVAGADATVLIAGESGTGKELVASGIHDLSRRRQRPLVSINCGAIPEATLESELFGHEKGAFTGADERHLGKFELASEGTLFLDEVGELPQAAQVKLLRALEQRNFYRVGGEKSVDVDVRIVAATNADLEARVKSGTFRSDLLYRLKVFVIDLPPLRSHPEDIPELVDHFLARSGGGHRVTKEGMERLLSYPWPGNVRELKNVLEREVILADDSDLDCMHLGAPGRKDTVGAKASLEEAERTHIVRVLRSVNWNKKAAAGILGIGRPTLYDRIKRYGIEERE